MLAGFLVFLVMSIPNTSKPAIVLMAPFETVKECQQVLDRAPKDQKDRFACVKIDMRPAPELPSI